VTSDVSSLPPRVSRVVRSRRRATTTTTTTTVTNRVPPSTPTDRGTNDDDDDASRHALTPIHPWIVFETLFLKSERPASWEGRLEILVVMTGAVRARAPLQS